MARKNACVRGILGGLCVSPVRSNGLGDAVTTLELGRESRCCLDHHLIPSLVAVTIAPEKVNLTVIFREPYNQGYLILGEVTEEAVDRAGRGVHNVSFLTALSRYPWDLIPGIPGIGNGFHQSYRSC